MPDLFWLIEKRWKQILAVILLSLLVGILLAFLKPREYMSVTTALPASSAFTDKSAVFNENIEALYSALGSSDELDRIVGTAELDTVYLAVSDKLDLVNHYKFGDAEDPRMKTAIFIKNNSRVYKSGHGDLRVKTWDKDNKKAADIANAIMEHLAYIYEQLQSRNNQLTLQQLVDARAAMKLQSDSTGVSNNQLLKYDDLISEYQLMLSKKTPVLLVIEKARPSLKPDRPRKLRILVVSVFAGAILGLLLAMFLERSKQTVS